MKTATSFTMRDVSRDTAKVFAAVRKFGHAKISTRSGEVFTIAAEPSVKQKPSQKEIMDDFFRVSEERAKRFREMGYVQPKAGEWDEERFNRIIAGEE
jgi:hypothetical protein